MLSGMKVTTQTPDLLIIDDRPWFVGLSLGIMALIFVGIGITQVLDGELGGLVFVLAVPPFMALFFFIFVRRTQLVLHGPEGWVEIRQRTLLGFNAIRHDLAEIERAIVETSRSSDSDTHRVTLIIPEGQSAGRHPVTQVYTSGGGAERAANAINHWLEGHRTRLK